MFEVIRTQWQNFLQDPRIILSIKDSLQQQIHFTGNSFGEQMLSL